MTYNKGDKMKSKECLERIIFEAKMEKPIFSMYYQEFLQPIEKDLEILEILKKHYDSNSLKKSLDSFISISICKTDKDFEKINEWLLK